MVWHERSGDVNGECDTSTEVEDSGLKGSWSDIEA